MRYFMLNLAIHCVVLVILIMLVCIFAKRNKKRKTKKVIAYFLPVVFAVLAILARQRERAGTRHLHIIRHRTYPAALAREDRRQALLRPLVVPRALAVAPLFVRESAV